MACRKNREKQFVDNKEFVLSFVGAVKSAKGATKTPQGLAVTGPKTGRNKARSPMKNSGGRVFLWHPFLNTVSKNSLEKKLSAKK
jgi:hypothetical protein